MEISKKLLLPFTSICVFLAALLFGALIILSNGDNPIIAYKALFAGCFNSSYNIANTLSSATPLIFTGLSVAVAFRTGIANIGAEGQLYVGAMAAAIVGIFVKLPAFALVPYALIISFITGGMYAMIPAVLKIKTNTDEVVTTLMLNYVATLFTSFLVNYPLKAKGAPIGTTVDIQEAAKLPLLYEGSRFNVGFIIAIAAAILIAVFFRYFSAGYEMRILGQNSTFGRYIGINADSRTILSMFISGGLAGLGGAVLVLGIQYRFVQNISPGYGFDGLTIALMAVNSSIAVVPFAILFGALRSGGLSMELSTNVPSELSTVIQAVVILFLAAQTSFTEFIRSFAEKLKKGRDKIKEGGVGNVGN